MAMVVAKMSGHLQTQLTRSLERLLEEAYLSGELKLTGRKLKDFPNVGDKYNLSDTVIAGTYGSFVKAFSLPDCFVSRQGRANGKGCQVNYLSA
jgi:hypothetical protein